jgi:uncharacterized protein (TIGR02145 family)
MKTLYTISLMMIILLLSSIQALPQVRTGHFNFEGGDPSSPLWTMYISEATLNSADLESGDEIAVFDGETMVGIFTLEQVCTPENQFDNDLTAFSELLSGPGYSAGNPVLLKCWDESEQVETALFEACFYDFFGTWPENVFPPDDGVYCLANLNFYIGGAIGGTVKSALSNEVIEGAVVRIEGTSYLTITSSNGKYSIADVMPITYNITANASRFYPQTKFALQIISEETIIVDFDLEPIIYTQSYTLETGYQFVSSQIILENPDMMEVVSEILTDDLIYIRNSDGFMLRKIGPNWVNGIGDWIETEGYLVKYTGTGEFSISGEIISPTTPIDLKAGFQFVSYLPVYEMDAMDAFASIISEDLLFIRNSEGEMLQKIGPNWVNGIGNSVPGQAYLIKMNSDDVLIYPATFPCGQPFTDFRNGQVYNTIQIGYQCWMAENLNIGTMINSSVDPTNNGEIEKYCYDDDTANCDEYGGLYQWDEMMEYSTIPGSPGICPIGWCIPCTEDMETLSDFLGGEDVSGGKLKEAGTVHWYPPNTGATNSSGFTGLPGGYIISSEYFNLGSYCHLWSSSETENNYAFFGILAYFNSYFFHDASWYKSHGYSVRCIRE